MSDIFRELMEREEREAREATERSRKRTRKLIFSGVFGLFGLVFLFLAINIVPEGHVGVKKAFAKAEGQFDPGIHFVIPFVNTVEIMEVRQRKTTEELAAATANQLPVTATVSVNWTLQKTAAMQTFIEYGGLNQFQERVLDPRLRTAAKAAISQFRADEMIRNRGAVLIKIQENLVSAMEGYPITINSPAIENFSLPPRYLEAVQAKEQAREDAEREKHALEKQRLVAMQAVNTANADAEAITLRAKAEAEAIKLKADAEAEAVKKVQDALSGNPLFVEYKKAERWNGALPQTILGDSSNILMSLKQ